MFSSLNLYIYCSTLISSIILHILIILLFTILVIIINLVIIFIIIMITITILFYLLISFSIYLLISGPIQPEGSPFGRFFNPGMLRVEGVG